MSEIRSLAALAFNTLEHKLAGAPRRGLAELRRLDGAAVALPAESPLFVTWTKVGDLRGCIGTFSARETLEQGVRSYAQIAGLEDSRFPPIRAAEIPKLAVAVTMLTPMEPIADKHDWVIGQHGVYAKFAGGLTAVFLPDVAEEQGWTQDETLAHLARKAGARSADGAQLFRYEGIKSTLSYAEYKAALDSLG